MKMLFHRNQKISYENTERVKETFFFYYSRNAFFLCHLSKWAHLTGGGGDMHAILRDCIDIINNKTCQNRTNPILN